MDTVNVQINTDKKKRNKKVLLAVVVPLAVLSVILCIFLMYIGILQYPDWYLKANFRANKQYFETIINIDECDGFSSGQEYYINEINSTEMKAAIQNLYVDGIWSFYKEYRHDEEEEYIYLYEDDYSSEDYADEKQREIAVCLFYPKHVNDYNKKLLMYVKDNDALNKYANPNHIQHIEDNWYYVHYHDNNPWDKGG